MHTSSQTIYATAELPHCGVTMWLCTVSPSGPESIAPMVGAAKIDIAVTSDCACAHVDAETACAFDLRHKTGICQPRCIAEAEFAAPDVVREQRLEASKPPVIQWAHQRYTAASSAPKSWRSATRMRRRGDIAFHFQVSQKRLDLGRAPVSRVALVVEQDEATRPIDIGAFGANRMVRYPYLYMFTGYPSCHPGNWGARCIT